MSQKRHTHTHQIYMLFGKIKTTTTTKKNRKIQYSTIRTAMSYIKPNDTKQKYMWTAKMEDNNNKKAVQWGETLILRFPSHWLNLIFFDSLILKFATTVVYQFQYHCTHGNFFSIVPSISIGSFSYALLFFPVLFRLNVTAAANTLHYERVCLNCVR